LDSTTFVTLKMKLHFCNSKILNKKQKETSVEKVNETENLYINQIKLKSKF
jgi:hypothetical protein